MSLSARWHLEKKDILADKKRAAPQFRLRAAPQEAATLRAERLGSQWLRLNRALFEPARQNGRPSPKFAQKRGWEFYWCPAGSTKCQSFKLVGIQYNLAVGEKWSLVAKSYWV
jgi:hypothetical protein